MNGRDPYGPEVTRDIQVGYYGKALDATSDQLDQQRFAYPVYTVFFLSPFVRLPFGAVRIIFFWLSLVVMLASIWIWLRQVNAQVSAFSFVGVAAIAMTSLPINQALRLQQLTIPVTGLLAVCALLLARKRYFLPGVLLAIAWIKPQVSILPSVWLLFWTTGDWRGRKNLFWSFVATITLFVIGGELLLPGWIPEFIHGLFAYQQYTGGGTVLTRTFPSVLNLVVSLFIAIVFPLACIASRRVPSDSAAFTFTFVLVLVVELLIVPALTGTFSLMLLLPALLLLLCGPREVWKKSWLSRLFHAGLAAIVIAPWILAVGVIVVWRFLPLRFLHQVWSLPLLPIPFLPFATFAGLSFVWREFTGSSFRDNAPGLGLPSDSYELASRQH